MKNPRNLLAAAAAAMLSASCAPQLQSTKTLMSSAPVPASDGGVAGDIHAQVNAYRQSQGKPALQRHAGLDRMARQHAEFMRSNRGKFGKGIEGNLTHYGFEERSMNARHTMGMSNVGENVGTCRGGSAARSLVGAWKNSSGHNMNLKGAWSQTGIGVVVGDDGTVFAAQLFGNRSQSHLTMTERMKQF